MIDSVLVLAGGEKLPPSIIEELPQGAYVIAADSGLDQARELGLTVHLLVGDLDSASPSALEWAAGVPTERHPVDKDATDLELALMAAARLDPVRVVVAGGAGGRLDHLLANAMLLCAPRFAGFQMEWVTAESRAHVVNATTRLHGSAGETVSLIPVGGAARGVATRGLRWTLAGQTLEPGTTLGVSNQMTGPVATISLEEGTLLVVHHGRL
jgi:thiamine pyrophosphokinase